MSEVVVDHAEDAVPVHALYEKDVPGFLDGRQAFVKAFAELSDFKGKAGQVLVTPNTEGGIDRVLFGLGDRADAQTFRALAAKLPAGEYRIASAPAEISPEQIALAFALGSYRFDRYKKKKDDRPRLVAAEQVDVAEVRSIAHACALARDMVNTPPNDMGPLQI
ncbi:M17 family peptidase N-terminal domain-containing protein, partial [Phenylobacterium sp.]